ncbi:MAG: aldehyde dehydrogenase family protein [Alphaproteobacteria bacterium]|nr:aldehyde dehydrogenase family protein [Alphaproteobacteria bacterium]
MSETDARQIERLKTLLARQKEAFADQRHRPIDQRKADIQKVADLTKNHAEDIMAAISADYGVRSCAETQIAEIGFVISAAKHAKSHVGKWAKARSASVPMTLAPGKAYVRREPKGVVGIVSPWNYPWQLAIAPLIAALSAGCRAIIKPSELTPKTADLMGRLLAEAFDESQVAVVTGGPKVGEAFTQQKFDHLFYTGSTHVGRLVAMAAADNLVPVTLELGGKSPAILTEDYDPADAASPLAWGKYFNAGQTCIAPDYVLAPRSKVEATAEAVLGQVETFFPDYAVDTDYTAIVSDRHHARLTAMIEEARAAGARVLQPKGSESGNARKLPPTIVIDPPVESQLMKEEIFGPILPILPYDTLNDAIAFVNERDHPLALYVYSRDKSLARSVLDRTISGGASVNASMLHMSVEGMPFGGVGASGQGAYHGEHGFLTFTHERAVFEAPKWHPSRLIAPPYGKTFDFISKLQSK